MATPVKANSYAVIQSASCCIGCNGTYFKVGERYDVIKSNGQLGKAYADISVFYGVSLWATENFGSFICKRCYRDIKRVLDMKEKVLELTQKVMDSSQHFIITTKNIKRVIERTPEKNSKRYDSSFTRGERNRVTEIRSNFSAVGSNSRDESQITRDARPSISVVSSNSRGESEITRDARPRFSVVSSNSRGESEITRDARPRFSVVSSNSRGESEITRDARPRFSVEKTPDKSTESHTRIRDTNEARVRTCLTYEHLAPVTPSPMEVAPTSPLTSLDCLERGGSITATSRRSEVTTYITLKQKALLGPVVKSLSHGSYRKAVRLLMSNDSVRKEVVKGLRDTVNREMESLVKANKGILQHGSEDDLISFSLRESTEGLKSTILWNVMCAASCREKKKAVDEVKVSTAALILLNARSKFLSRFQFSVSVAMYNNQLQREGFNILSRMGLTVSHSALHRCLHKAQLTVDRQMEDLKAGIERNEDVRTVTGIAEEHSYSSAARGDEVTPDHLYVQHVQPTTKIDFNPGYRFNIDNLDFLLKVRDMTESHQNKSKHYVQAMAVVDRVPCEHLPDDRPTADLLTIPLEQFLPSEEDNSRLREDLIHVTALILTEHVPAFKAFEGLYKPFFEHKYSEYMEKKSTVLPLGILDKSENKTNEMIDILEYLHKYVPNARTAAEVEAVDIREEEARFRAIPLGGDQLTCERIRGAHIVRLDGDTPEERLEGCIAMIEDFHEKMNFLQIIIDKYYKAGSAREAGTLYQLRNFINRRNVSSNVTSNYHNASAFIDLVGEGHVIAAVLEFFGMEALASPCPRIPRGAAQEGPAQRKRTLHQIIGEFVDEILMNRMQRQLQIITENRPDQADEEVQDRILNYGLNVMKYCLLRRVNIAATRSGDGDRVIRHWKYALLLYDSAHKTKYRLESFLFLAAMSALYTPRQREQVVWNRFISLSGGKGKNLDGDYVMELLNKYAKSRVRLVGPNHSSELVMRIGKTMMFCHDVQVQLERQVKTDFLSRDHTSQNVQGDLMKIIGELQKAQVFKNQPGRSHPSFEEEPMDIFSPVDPENIQKWLQEKKEEYANNKLAF